MQEAPLGSSVLAVKNDTAEQIRIGAHSVRSNSDLPPVRVT